MTQLVVSPAPKAVVAEPSAPEPNATPDAPSTIGGLVYTMLTRGSPRILLLLTLGFAVSRLTMGSWTWVDAAVPLAIAVWWPFQEWLIHTYLLHLKPRRVGPFTIDSAQAKKHRRHHMRPWDFAEISIPLRTYVTAVPLLGVIAYFGLGTPAVFTGVAVFCAFGVHYEWCHFMAHSNYVPKTKLYKAVWKNHRLHHFKNETLWMGVSTRFGDRVLGTCPDQKTVKRSLNCRTLGIPGS